MAFHIVRQGEDIHTIAYDHGFADGGTIYDHPSNRELRQLRPSPEVLHPGDRVFIPEREDAKVNRPTGAQHRFRVRRPERRLKLRLIDLHGDPHRNAEYQIAIAGEQRNGRTNANGVLDEKLPAAATEARLTIAGAALQLTIGHLNPMEDTDDDGVSGVQARLLNLGFAPGPVDGTLNDRTRAAIRAFRQENDLPDGDDITAPLRDKLREKHGC